MPKQVKLFVVIVFVAILWGVLASIDAGLAGFGVILSLLALLDVVAGEFEGNNKVIWLVVCLAGLAFAAAAIGSTMLATASPSSKHPLYVMGTAIALILPVAYFLVGKGQKTASEK